MKRATFMGMIASLLLAGHATHAQQATEVYIPIGKSPGVSNSKSIVGAITGIDHADYRMTVSVGGARKIISMTPVTLYYLDRTRDRKQSRTATILDCEVGLRVEAYLDEAGNAIWVKIEAGE